MLPAAYHVPAAVLLVGGGLLACFVGQRLFRVVLGLYGFVTGAMLTSAIMGPGETSTVLLAMLGGGLAGALLLILAYFVGVALIGAALGAVAVHVVWMRLGGEPHPLIVIGGTVAGALTAMALQRFVIIAATAFGGAWTALAGALVIAGDRTAQATDGWVLYPLRPPDGQRWVFVGWVVLSIVGMVVQLATRPRARR